jgi:hypothetical protein
MKLKISPVARAAPGLHANSLLPRNERDTHCLTITAALDLKKIPANWADMMKKLRGYTPKKSESGSIVEQIPDDKMLEFCLGLKDLIPDHRTRSIRCHQRRP